MLELEDAAAWRRWLERHHTTERGVVLRLSKKAVPEGLHYLDALEEALCFGWIDGKLRGHNDTTFLQRFSPRRADSVWSESNRQRVERLIRKGRMTRAGLATVKAAKRSGAWQAAYLVSRVPRMPSDLREALRANSEAWDHFRAWAPAYRSACIRIVADAKREATRKNRVHRVVRRAAQDKRPGIEGF